MEYTTRKMEYTATNEEVRYYLLVTAKNGKVEKIHDLIDSTEEIRTIPAGQQVMKVANIRGASVSSDSYEDQVAGFLELYDTEDRKGLPLPLSVSDYRHLLEVSEACMDSKIFKEMADALERCHVQYDGRGGLMLRVA